MNLDGMIAEITSSVTANNQFSKFKKLYKNDRIAFVHDIMPELGKSIAPYQENILGMMDDGKDRIAVRGPHGLGKTFLASIVVHHAVLTAETDTKVPTTASVWRQLEKYLWPEIRKSGKYLAWSEIGRSPYSVSQSNMEQHATSIRLDDGLTEAFAVASDNYTALEGAHASQLLYVLDEAKVIPAPMWDAIEGAFSTEGLGTQTCRAFAISTPGDPVGRFYDIHMRKPGYEDWTCIHVTLEDAIRAGRISRKWAEQRRAQWGETSSTYQNRVLGEFADNSDNGIIPLSWVRKAIERYKAWDMSGRPALNGRIELGVDVAREGDDKTVIVAKEGSAVIRIWEFAKLPTTSVAGNVQRITVGSATSHNVSTGSRLPTIVDSSFSKLFKGNISAIKIEMDGGLGAAVYDMLREEGVANLRPVTVAGKTWKRDKSGELSFANVRTAMWWNLREMLDPINGEGLMLPDHSGLIADLVTPQWTTLRDGVIALESKDSIRKRLGRSTDYGDSTCLAFWTANSGGGVVF